MNDPFTKHCTDIARKNAQESMTAQRSAYESLNQNYMLHGCNIKQCLSMLKLKLKQI